MNEQQQTAGPHQGAHGKWFVVAAAAVAVLGLAWAYAGVSRSGEEPRISAPEQAEEAAPQAAAPAVQEPAFPADFPVYEGAVQQVAHVTADGGKTVRYGTWTTGDTVAAVRAYYVQKLEAAGYVITANGELNDMVSVVFTRAEGQQDGWLTISRVDEGTTEMTVALGGN